jgi:hypothetical protein
MSSSFSLDWDHADPPQPRVADCYVHAARSFVAHLPPLLGIGLCVGLVVVASSALTHAHGIPTLVGLALGAFVATPLKWGFYGICLDAVRGRRVDAANLVRVQENYREVVIAGVVSTLLVLAGLVFLILPGLYLYLRLQFVPYLVVNEGLDAGGAIRESLRLTRGLEAPILGIVVVGLAASLAGLLMAGLGLLPALVWWDLAMASLYCAEVRPSASAAA